MVTMIMIKMNAMFRLVIVSSSTPLLLLLLFFNSHSPHLSSNHHVHGFISQSTNSRVLKFQQLPVTDTNSHSSSTNMLLKQCRHHRQRQKQQQQHRNHRTKIMLRNFDLPEAIIFYGMDTVLQYTTTIQEEKEKTIMIRPGVFRLLQECQQVQTPVIILSEHLLIHEMIHELNTADQKFWSQYGTDIGSSKSKNQLLHCRSSLEDYTITLQQQEEDFEYHSLVESLSTFYGKGIGYAPCPAALVDAIHSIIIQPRGFGGSSGFGTKYADAVRNPLPQHCVVFVSNSSDDDTISNTSTSNGSRSRDRAIAAHLAGMRVMYIEEDDKSCTAEDIADGIVSSLGTEQDWEMVTLDDISTPGSFWLNMAQPKDEFGNRVDTMAVITDFIRNRSTSSTTTITTSSSSSSGEGVAIDTIYPSQYNTENAIVEDSIMNDDDLAQILADLDPL